MASHSQLADEMGLGSTRVVNSDVLHLDSTDVIALHAYRQDGSAYLDRA